MKIVEKDNHCLAYFVEETIAEVPNKYFGELIVKFLNSRIDDNSSVYFDLVEDDYELQINPFEP